MIDVLYKEEVDILNAKRIKNLAFRVYITLRKRGYNFLKRVFCFVGQKSLADELGVSIRAIQMALNELINAGLIKRIRRGLTKVNIYVFPLLERLFGIQKTDKEYKEEVEKIERKEETKVEVTTTTIEKPTKKEKKQQKQIKNYFNSYGGQRKYDIKALEQALLGKISYEEFMELQKR